MSELSIETHPAAPARWTQDSTSKGPAAQTAAELAVAVNLVLPELGAVEQQLRRLLQSDIAIIPALCEDLAFAGGKRLRPLLTLLSAQAVGMERERAVCLAAVGELLHTATLLHDDVVDASDLRRGRPSARYVYGNAMAVLGGDFCLSQAVSCAAELGEITTLRSVARVVTRMSEGEVAQLQVAGQWTLDRAGYYAICERKTAELIAWCTSLSGLLPAPTHAALHGFGLELGYAFQIADDVIDYRESSEKSGKSCAQDIREGKSTLPLILAQERSPDLAKLLPEPGRPLSDAERIAEVMARVTQCGALDEATRIAKLHAQKAQVALSTLSASPAKDALFGLSEHVAQRSN